uniref:F-box domain-containing protein n=1 Tax=Oryza punctata TaxID=4537 RepID=A0A0E0M5E0_ORYPU
MSEAEMTSRRRRPTSPAQPLEDDDLLSEILLRLPPLPSSLPRASVVCSRWRLIVSNPRFLRRFQSRHRKTSPPRLLQGRVQVNHTFIPTLDPPDRIPAARFSWRLPGDDDRYSMLGCRHGLVLLFNRILHRLMVWDPATGDRRAVDIPGSFLDGHGRSLVVVSQGGRHTRKLPTANTTLHLRLLIQDQQLGQCHLNEIYSVGYICHYSTLVGNSVYWLFQGDGISILQFDFDTQRLARIDLPPDVHAHVVTLYQIQIVPAEDGGLVLLVLPDFSLNVWKYKTYRDGVAGWSCTTILGFVEEHNEVFLRTDIGAFMVNLHSMQFKKLSQTMEPGFYHPFTKAAELLPQCDMSKKPKVTFAGALPAIEEYGSNIGEILVATNSGARHKKKIKPKQTFYALPYSYGKHT